jgi:hypothetical protein
VLAANETRADESWFEDRTVVCVAFGGRYASHRLPKGPTCFPKALEPERDRSSCSLTQPSVSGADKPLSMYHDRRVPVEVLIWKGNHLIKYN